MSSAANALADLLKGYFDSLLTNVDAISARHPEIGEQIWVYFEETLRRRRERATLEQQQLNAGSSHAQEVTINSGQIITEEDEVTDVQAPLNTSQRLLTIDKWYVAGGKSDQ